MNRYDVELGLWLGGLVLCSPLIGLYYGGKWLYNHTPQKMKERRRKEALNKEIKAWEKKLGLVNRDEDICHYDPYFYKNEPNTREGYLEELKEKVRMGYVSPDIIMAIGRSKRMKNYEVVFLVRKSAYNQPEYACEFSSYFPFYHPSKINYSKMMCMFTHILDEDYDDEKEERRRKYFHTISAECGRYDEYFVIAVPGEYPEEEAANSERLQTFIEEFTKENKKE